MVGYPIVVSDVSLDSRRRAAEVDPNGCSGAAGSGFRRDFTNDPH
jgi:hypothetical protein